MIAGRRPRAILFVLAHAVVIQLITFAMRPTLSYAVLDVGGSPALLGVVVAAFAVPALILALPAGHVIDRIGERPSLLVGAGALIAAAADRDASPETRSWRCCWRRCCSGWDTSSR